VILGIDGHCLRGDGGSVTHLREVLRAANPGGSGFEKVILWSGAKTLARIDDRPWLEKRHEPELDRALLKRSSWSSVRLSVLAREARCDVLWVPGCSFAGSFRPYVAMSRNMLPFEWHEMMRYGVSSRFLKFFSLRFSQSRTFARSSGMMFLTDYAREKVEAVIGAAHPVGRVIPHGIEARFAPRAETARADAAGDGKPFRLLYVSVVDVYKHQWRVVEAVSQLQSEGARIELVLIGPAYPPALKKLEHALRDSPLDPGSVRYLGPVPHSELDPHYRAADAFVYASSCENLPNILLEAMASGIPIASSDRGPMPEVLRDAGVYFDPEKPAEIAAAVRRYLESSELRQRNVKLALDYASEYSWERCARESFDFLAEVAALHRSTRA
jgi:glycosyltransferase involved in cell wall biosynthesis